MSGIRHRNQRTSSDSALFHDHGSSQLLRQHFKEIQEVFAGTGDFTELRTRLFNRITDVKTLHHALTAMARTGPTASGPDGITASELLQANHWEYCRSLQNALRERIYRRGSSREVAIPKPGKAGKRIIRIDNVCDRMLARAAFLILSPMIDPTFSSTSFGFRPGRGVWDALVAIFNQIRDGRATWVATADIKSAFDVVPAATVDQIVRACFGDDVCELVHVVCSTGTALGLRQGSPLSPFAFNLFADGTIDKQWAQRASTSLLRYADDLCFTATLESEAMSLGNSLMDICNTAGTPLKGPPQVRSVEDGVEWLGFVLSFNGTPRCRIAERAWPALRNALHRCHEAADAPALALAESVVRGWLAYLGPAFDSEDVPDVLRRLLETAKEEAFYELPDEDELRQTWQDAASRWHAKVRDRRSQKAESVQTEQAAEFIATDRLPWEA